MFLIGCGGALLGVQCASGENNGGACVAGSAHPLAPNTAESSPRQAIQPPPPPPLITSPSVSPCLQFRHVSVFLLSCLSVSFCLQPTKTAIQPWRWWAGRKCHGCTDLLQLGLLCCLSLTEGSLFSIAPVGDGGAAKS